MADCPGHIWDKVPEEPPKCNNTYFWAKCRNCGDLSIMHKSKIAEPGK